MSRTKIHKEYRELSFDDKLKSLTKQCLIDRLKLSLVFNIIGLWLFIVCLTLLLKENKYNNTLAQVYMSTVELISIKDTINKMANEEININK